MGKLCKDKSNNKGGIVIETKAFIKTPERIPFYLKIGLLISKMVTKKDLLPPKLLAWYPKVAVSSAVLETLIANGKKDLNVRILQLVRIQVSIIVACPFCLDMNLYECEKSDISEEELQGLAGRTELEQIKTLSIKEKLAIQYAKLISQNPVIITDEFIEKVKSEYTEREIVIIVSTAAQVNYWARMIKALGVPPEGFSDKCNLNKI